MSVADFKRYGQMIAEDDDVRAKAKTIGMNDLDGQIAYAKELGLEFNVDDMTELAQESGISQDELSEEQLEQVAGGAVTITAAAVVGAVVGVAALGINIGSEASRNW